MKTLINKDEYIIIFEEKTIDDLTFINNKINVFIFISKIPSCLRLLLTLKSGQILVLCVNFLPMVNHFV